jgi:hypothetical protein
MFIMMTLFISFLDAVKMHNHIFTQKLMYNLKNKNVFNVYCQELLLKPTDPINFKSFWPSFLWPGIQSCRHEGRQASNCEGSMIIGREAAR